MPAVLVPGMYQENMGAMGAMRQNHGHLCNRAAPQESGEYATTVVQV